jgi:hypothetical protein
VDALAVILSFVRFRPSASASAQDFWKHWGDGGGELSGYRLSQLIRRGARIGGAHLRHRGLADGPRKSESPQPAGITYPVLAQRS